MRAFAGIGGLKNLLQALGFIFGIGATLAPQLITRSNLSKEVVEKNIINFIKHLFPQVYLVDKIYVMNNIPGFFISLAILLLMALILFILSFPLSKLMIAGVLRANTSGSRAKRKGEINHIYNQQLPTSFELHKDTKTCNAD